MSTRGIIISAPVKRLTNIPDEIMRAAKAQETTAHTIARLKGELPAIAVTLPINPIDLRQYVLYWDIIEVSSNSNKDIQKCEPSPEMRMLMDNGILVEKNQLLVYRDWRPPETRQDAAAIVSMIGKSKEANSQHKWVIGQTGNGLTIPNFLMKGKQLGFGIDLYQALPIFGAEVTIENILAFKRRRNNELQRLRIALDKLVLAVSIAEQLEVAIMEVKQSVIDLNEAAYDFKKGRAKRAMSALITAALPAGSVGIWIANWFPKAAIPLGIAGAMMGLWSQDIPGILNFTPEKSDPFAYTFHAQKKLGAGAAWKK